MKIVLIHCLRNADPRLPEMPGLADMKIGNDQRVLPFPIERSLGSEYEVLIANNV